MEKDSNQPEMQLSAKAYLQRMVNEYRITKGVRAFQDNKALLQEISTKYGIPTTVIVAVWGIESSYGAFLGSWDVIEALVTLAFQSQKMSRANYFKEELIQALLLLDEGQLCVGDRRLKGSWAGAMGQCQFMPSSLRQYGVDYDEDGFKDIWQSHADVFASMANYLHMHGWKVDSLLAHKVFVPENIDKNVIGLKVKKTIIEWKHNHNVHGLDEQFEQLPIEMVSLVAPEGPSGATYLVGDNFRALMRYNTSSLYCLAVYELANEILKRVG
ncbi:hypothetical protein O6H91_20G037500 [Diphasiastrum complanatum]|nr:hypothetical protein O6H91_20G037500 [Diphasiastrum complanatum]